MLGPTPVQQVKWMGGSALHEIALESQEPKHSPADACRHGDAAGQALDYCGGPHQNVK